jgi:uncharacterized protein YaaQ
VGELARQDVGVLQDCYEESAVVVDMTGVTKMDEHFIDAWLGNGSFMHPGRTVFLHGIENEEINNLVVRAMKGQIKINPAIQA